MSEKVKTILFAVVALVLGVGAWLAVPSTRSPELFDDQGEAFYPAFDPLAAASVEIVAYDDARDRPRPFKVHFVNSRWTIPSHEDYPADAERQLGQTASVVNDLRKGVIRSDRKADFDKFGVGDPLDASRMGAGAGKRVILKDGAGQVLTDLIIGSEVEGRSGEYYVRRPDSNRTYACRFDASHISTRFADWVETDLLKLQKEQIRRMVLDNYRVDEETRTKVEGETLTLEKDESAAWSLRGGVGKKEELDTAKVDDVVRTLSELTLVGVRRKPAGLLTLLAKIKSGKAIDRGELFKLQDLAAIGFYLAPDEKTKKVEIASNEGEMRLACKDGVTYALYFGEILYGDPDDISGRAGTPTGDEAGKKDEKTDADKGAEHRYVMIDAGFDASLLGKAPKKPAEPKTADTAKLSAEEKKKKEEEDKKAVERYEADLKDYEDRVKKGRERAEELRRRFADWYYVVSAGDFKTLHLSRKDLVKPKKEEKSPEKDAKDAPKPGS